MKKFDISTSFGSIPIYSDPNIPDGSMYIINKTSNQPYITIGDGAMKILGQDSSFEMDSKGNITVTSVYATQSTHLGKYEKTVIKKLKKLLSMIPEGQLGNHKYIQKGISQIEETGKVDINVILKANKIYKEVKND